MKGIELWARDGGSTEPASRLNTRHSILLVYGNEITRFFTCCWSSYCARIIQCATVLTAPPGVIVYRPVSPGRRVDKETCFQQHQPLSQIKANSAFNHHEQVLLHSTSTINNKNSTIKINSQQVTSSCPTIRENKITFTARPTKNTPPLQFNQFHAFYHHRKPRLQQQRSSGVLGTAFQLRFISPAATLSSQITYQVYLRELLHFCGKHQLTSRPLGTSQRT